MYLANRKTKKGSGNKKKFFIILIIILILLPVGIWIWHEQSSSNTSASTVQTNTGTPATASPNVPGNTSENPTTGESASKDSDANQPGTPPGSGVQPAAPTGQFVSYHHPNLSGSPGPNTETSTCTTTPGVECKITFTNGSVTKSLPAQRTDSNGNTLWSNWKLQGIGLTKGTWTVKAVAINGSKTASAQDATPLVVST